MSGKGKAASSDEATLPSVAESDCHLPAPEQVRGDRKLVCTSPRRPAVACGSTGSGPTDRTERLECRSVRPSRRTSRTAFTAEPPAADDPLLQFAPYLHAAPRGNSITPDKQRAFIACLAATGIVTQAARSIGASLEALYNLRRRTGAEGFAAAWEAAVDLGVARLEDCAVELAIAGEELPIVSGGKLLGTYTKHNFGHIRFVLSQRRSGRWNAAALYADLRPGHPVYDELRRHWMWEREQAEPDIEDVRAEVLRRLEVMSAHASGGVLRQAQDERELDEDPA